MNGRHLDHAIGFIPPWTEEDKARLDLAIHGKSHQPLAWVRADGKLFSTEKEAKEQTEYKIYPLYAHPQIMEGYKWLKDTTFDERSFSDDLAHENGSYHCSCVVCGRIFQGHKSRVICKVCSTKETNEPQKTSS